MIIPTDELPLTAQILDASKLKEQQAFYRDAQNGDVLLIM